MPDTYYVDGYNVLHTSSLLRPLVEQDFESARDAFIDKVAAFCVATGKRVVVVFDGRGRHQPEALIHNHRVAGLEILFSPSNLSADAVIERQIHQQSNRLEAVVVSNDRGLRELCRGMGALTMEADNFLATVREAAQETRATLDNVRRGSSIEHLEDRLDSGSMARLEDLKKRL